MFYPANFPTQLEDSLIKLLQLLEQGFEKKAPLDQKSMNRLLMDSLKLQKDFKAIKPSAWWLNFILIRHQSRFSSSFIKQIKQFLVKTKTRSLSGIVPLTLFTKGTGCPFSCVYCPNEPGMPKSYFSDEPAVMRAIRHHFDPFKQTLQRLVMFYLSGHSIDKVEIIIKGGTFSFYKKQYRRWFVRRVFDACNVDIEKYLKSGQIDYVKTVKTLFDSQKENETAKSRIIGINIETRPDYINDKELVYLRTLGVTHVEIGVQMPSNKIYFLIKRNHTVKQVMKATSLLRSYGLKIGYHLMPNLPGTTPSLDLQLMKEIFSNPWFKPDHLKLYPTTITTHTKLFEWFKNETYKPYSLDELIEIIIKFKSEVVPPWVRIGRLTRDITTDAMQIKQFAPNLREIIQKKMHDNNKICSCIRCREIKDLKIVGKPYLHTISYNVSNGKEFFLEFTDDNKHSLGFIRLFIPHTQFALAKSLAGAALIRELHVYGQVVPIGKKEKNTIQHHHFGIRLLKEAEKLSTKQGSNKIAIIAGVGTRKYYEKFGYNLIDTYMVKNI